VVVEFLRTGIFVLVSIVMPMEFTWWNILPCSCKDITPSRTHCLP